MTNLQPQHGLIRVHSRDPICVTSPTGRNESPAKGFILPAGTYWLFIPYGWDGREPRLQMYGDVPAFYHWINTTGD